MQLYARYYSILVCDIRQEFEFTTLRFYGCHYTIRTTFITGDLLYLCCCALIMRQKYVDLIEFSPS